MTSDDQVPLRKQIFSADKPPIKSGSIGKQQRKRSSAGTNEE